jgi:enoyl-[acyl-carrier protein] reductase II
MNNRITQILGTKFPLIQGPMRQLTMGEVAAAVSNSGGFGQIAASRASGEELRSEIKKARSLTNKPFGINIPIFRPNALEALTIAIEMGIKTITTSAGSPAKMIGRIKEAGLKVLHKVSTLDMALKAESLGVDAVIAMGYEAGGHIGREDTTTFCLVPQLTDALKIPVVAAGGIGDARGLVAALALGAEGVEVGTRLVATQECPAPDFFKQSILDTKGNNTILLGKGSMPSRVLRNQMAEALSNPNRAEKEEIAKGEQGYIKGDKDTAILPAGQVAGLISDIKRINQIFPQMVEEGKKLSSDLYDFFK